MSDRELSAGMPPAGGRLRLGYVPGATPGKWVRAWAQRYPDVPLDLVPVPAADAERALRAGEVDVAILRLPIEREGLAVVPLYEERPVVVVARDHLLAALEAHEEVAMADLSEEVVLRPRDDALPWSGAADLGRAPVRVPETTLEAIQLVAAGIGVVIVPQSLARLHHRKDVTYRSLRDGPAAPVALAWVSRGASARIDDFYGIVRGRTVNSSRGAPRDEPADGSAPGEAKARPGRPRRAGPRGRRATRPRRKRR